MPVQVRLFAAAREAAGTAEAKAPGGPLHSVLEELRQRFGSEFSRRLEICTVLVDGQATRHDSAAIVPDGAEVAILPPVSGGGAGLRCPLPAAP